VAINWAKEDDDVIPHREFETPVRVYAIYLFPGGRWLLTANMDGSVQYFDLDTDTPRPAILIPPQLAHTYEVYPCMVVEIDVKAPTLTFNLALVMIAKPFQISERLGNSLRKVQVWKVSLDFDEQDRAVGFTSQCLCNFSENHQGICYSISLRGSRLAYCIDYGNLPEAGRTTVLHIGGDIPGITKQMYTETFRPVCFVYLFSSLANICPVVHGPPSGRQNVGDGVQVVTDLRPRHCGECGRPFSQSP